MKISLLKGYAEVPDGTTVVDLSGGMAADIGIISDKSGELTPVVVVSDKSVRGLSVEEEDSLVDEAIRDLPQYQEAKSQEMPYPTCNASQEEWERWNESFRLGFFPLAMFENLADTEYRLYEEG